MYYLQSRYYDPEIGRFINADNYPTTGQGLLGNNMFAYCNNCPVNNKDTQGTAVETVLDVISLASSIVDVAMNPADPWAWVGLVGDIADVCIPFVGGIGEAVDAIKVVAGVVENTDDVVDAAKTMKRFVSKTTGSYEIVYKSGSTYVGKGGFNRAIKSAQRNAAKYSDEVTAITWKSAPNAKAAFIDEYQSMCKYGGPNNRTIRNANSYNQIWSPGRNYYRNDYGSYYCYGGRSW